ncbi:MAG: hypothetical protein Q4C54_01905, partial [Clostridia bacterium]|nr:hypothetical protein [Clostridia bacterium]
MQKNQKKKQAPKYSADALALRLAIGVVLIAIGVLFFLSTVVNIQGTIFEGARTIARGLAGCLAPLLPLIPAAAGVVLILSSQRKVNAFPVLYGALFIWALLAMMNLASRTQGYMLMDLIRADNARYFNPPDTFDAFMSKAWMYGNNPGFSIGGGVLGMLISWPLWKLAGSVGGILITVLLLAAALVMTVCLGDIRRIGLMIDRIRGKRRRQGEMQHQADVYWQQQTPPQQGRGSSYGEPVMQQYRGSVPQPAPYREPAGRENARREPSAAGSTRQPVGSSYGMNRPVNPFATGRSPVASKGSTYGFAPVDGEEYVTATREMYAEEISPRPAKPGKLRGLFRKEEAPQPMEAEERHIRFENTQPVPADQYKRNRTPEQSTRPEMKVQPEQPAMPMNQA